MTWEQMMADEYGYKTLTTFWMDFSIADRFGAYAIKDTFKSAMVYAKTNYKYLTELVMVLNHKIWQHYSKNDTIAKLYDDLWRNADQFAYEHLKGKELEYFTRTLD